MADTAFPQTMQPPRKDAASYVARRAELEHYFDRTAAEAWERLTSDAPVSKVRATVRAGRDRMRAVLLARLGERLSGRAVLDAGCGTGALAAEAAGRGAAVTAVDLSPTMVAIARERHAAALPEGEPARAGRIAFHAGDMLDPAFGDVDHAVMMDSLIHYRLPDILAALVTLAPRVRRSMVFTVAPRTPALTLMHAVGKAFPRGDRSPAIAPVAPRRLLEAIAREPALRAFRATETERVASGFYTSEAVELVRQ
jgi:magnesium-protoporphyrin O-methyltransferase